MKKYYIAWCILFCTLFGIPAFANETIKIGYCSSIGPLQYNDASGNPTGISVNLIAEIMEHAGLDVEFIPYDTEDITPEILNDLDILAPVAVTEHTNLPQFSEGRASIPYYNTPLLLTGIRNFDNDSEMTIGIYNYKNASDDLILKLIPNAEIIYIQNLDDLEPYLHTGYVNFMFSTTVTSQVLLRTDTAKRFQSYPYTFEIPLELIYRNDFPENDEEKINDAIRTLNAIEKNNIVFRDSYDYSLDDSFRKENNLYSTHEVARNTALVICFMTILCGAIFLIYKSYTEKLTLYDRLTNFYTEYKFNLELEKLLAKAKPHQYTVVSVDIDNFKYINEMYQVASGNEILLSFSKYLKKSYPTALFFSRVHSDNFLILLEQNEESNAERPIKFNSPVIQEILGEFYQIYTSVGVYHISDPQLHSTSILNCVNLARETGKVTYGNTSVIFNDKMDKIRKTQNKIVTSMEKALQNKEFEVHYQPKMNLKTKKICGAEALIRWKLPNGGAIYPDEFIPLFEKNRYITKLDFYVFENVCEFIANNKDVLAKDIVISVNVSTVTLLLPELQDKLLRILQTYQIAIECIELEITEGAFVENFDFIIYQIKKLKEFGFSIALDDFGSGISSLNQLKNIELDVLKLDKAFLSNSLEDHKGIIVVENVVALAKDLGLKIVAEGVETQADCDILYDLECDIIQGYFFARPMPAQNFREFILTN